MGIAKRRGSKFETDVVAYLATHGSPAAERRVMGGSRDRGDVAGIPNWTLELKADRALDMAAAIREAAVEFKLMPGPSGSPPSSSGRASRSPIATS